MTYKEFIEYNKTRDQGPYTQKHHIIPTSMGGSKTDPNNIIRLSWLTHYYAHYLLAKENPDNKQIQRYWKVKGDIDRWLHWCYDTWQHALSSWDEDTKKKMSKSHMGKKQSEETKRKISESQKKRLDALRKTNYTTPMGDSTPDK